MIIHRRRSFARTAAVAAGSIWIIIVRQANWNKQSRQVNAANLSWQLQPLDLEDRQNQSYLHLFLLTSPMFAAASSCPPCVSLGCFHAVDRVPLKLHCCFSLSLSSISSKLLKPPMAVYNPNEWETERLIIVTGNSKITYIQLPSAAFVSTHHNKAN